MQNKEAIAALQQQIEGLRQDLALGVISKSEFGTERGKLLEQIDVLDTRPNCLYSAEPKPYPHIPSLFNSARTKAEQFFKDLLKLKFRNPQDARIIRREATRAILAIPKAETIQDLERIYDTAQKAVNEAKIDNLIPFDKAA